MFLGESCTKAIQSVVSIYSFDPSVNQALKCRTLSRQLWGSFHCRDIFTLEQFLEKWESIWDLFKESENKNEEKDELKVTYSYE